MRSRAAIFTHLHLPLWLILPRVTSGVCVPSYHKAFLRRRIDSCELRNRRDRVSVKLNVDLSICGDTCPVNLISIIQSYLYFHTNQTVFNIPLNCSTLTSSTRSAVGSRSETVETCHLKARGTEAWRSWPFGPVCNQTPTVRPIRQKQVMQGTVYHDGDLVVNSPRNQFNRLSAVRRKKFCHVHYLHFITVSVFFSICSATMMVINCITDEN